MINLNALLKPKSIAVIGASRRPFRAGCIIMQNLLQGEFQGAIMPVTPKYPSVSGILAYPSIDKLPIVPELAIICTNAKYNIKIFQELAEKGVGAVIVISSDMHIGISEVSDKYNNQFEPTTSIDEACLTIAQAANMRVLGSNSLGVMLPWLNINASLSPVSASKGNIAFISQSASVCTTILDWAYEQDIGFSAFISTGNSVDVDFAELLDTLSVDHKTSAILLYVNSIKDARRFMSAARSASRNRRILILKSGRHSISNDACFDVIYDSAITRSGMLRVHTMSELFAACKTLTHSTPLRGERLAIITNGGGPAIMAVDALIERGGKLATLPDTCIDKLCHVLPRSWSKSNPIDILGDADSARYISTLEQLLDSEDIDAILIMHSPSAVAHSTKTAQNIINCITAHPKSRQFNILTNWAGEKTAQDARLLFAKAGIPSYRTPEAAVGAYMHLVEYRRNQKQLTETPLSLDKQQTRKQVEQQKQTAINWLNKQIDKHLDESVLSPDNKATTANISPLKLDSLQLTPLLTTYGFTALPTSLAIDDKQAVNISDSIGYPVAIKLCSDDIEHKSDVQGVALNLNSAKEVTAATLSILERTHHSYPNANIKGVLVQNMATRFGAQELRVKITTDAIFGPVLMLGQGGSEWNIANDTAVSLLPLNMALARYLVIRAIKSNKIRLDALPTPVNMNALCQFLVRLSQMVIDCPQILSLDLHPLLAVDDQFTIIDASLVLNCDHNHPRQKLAIKPYPVEQEELITLTKATDLLDMDQPVLLRPILPEDELQLALFITQVSREDLYKRFFSEVGEFNHEALSNLTQIDYDREMAFVAVIPNDIETDTQTDSQIDNQTAKVVNKNEKIIAVVRVIADPHNSEAEFSILVRSDLKGLGLGRTLMEKVIHYSHNKGTQYIVGITMPSNKGMVSLAKRLGFTTDIHFEDNSVDMRLKL